MNKSNIVYSAAMILSLTLSRVNADENCGMSGMEAKPGAPAKTSEIKMESQGSTSEAFFPEIGQQELVKVITDKSVFIVDANGTESYTRGHIPGAIDFGAAGDKLTSMLPKDKNALIVAYCGGPGCHAWCKAADQLQKMGYHNVKHFKGGIKGWKTAGLKMETAETQKG